MSLILSLTTTFGKPIAEALLSSLRNRKNGLDKLETATAAMTAGATAIEALKKSFGKEFLISLNDALGSNNEHPFDYHAGTSNYIKLDEETNPINILRDELNINLDRLSVIKSSDTNLKNHFRGLVSVWKTRCNQNYGEIYADDIMKTMDSVENLISEESKNYRQIYNKISSTALGGLGTLMVISGVLIASGIGVGAISGITMFIFGIPWLTVASLTIPGAALLILSRKKAPKSVEISLAIAIIYKLLDRIEKSEKQAMLDHPPLNS